MTLPLIDLAAEAPAAPSALAHRVDAAPLRPMRNGAGLFAPLSARSKRTPGRWHASERAHE